MKHFVFLLALALWDASVVAAQAACAKPPAGSGTRFYIEPVTVLPTDTLISARLCVAPTAAGLGSYMATMSYDSTRMTVARVETTGGMQAANSRVPGSIRIAGASPGGFPPGLLATVRFARRGATALGRVSLLVSEASTPGGASLAGGISAIGWPATVPRAQQRPIIDSISPRSGEVGPDRVTDIAVFGRGFAAAGNIVVFAGVEVTGLLSEGNGSVIRFAAPSRVPARSGTAGARIERGRVEIRVKSDGGTSNAVTFIVKEDP